MHVDRNCLCWILLVRSNDVPRKMKQMMKVLFIVPVIMKYIYWVYVVECSVELGSGKLLIYTRPLKRGKKE